MVSGILELVGLVIAVLLNAALSITAALRNKFLFPSNLDDALIHLMIYGFVLPIALALSIRNLPLFMRLAFSPSRELFPILVSYVASVLLRLFALLEQPFVIDSALVARLVNLSAVLEGGALLVGQSVADVASKPRSAYMI